LFDPNLSTIGYFAPDTSYNLKTFSQIASFRKETVAQTLLYLISAMEDYQKSHPNYSGSGGSMNGKSMSEEDVETFISWPQSVICSDGNGGSHPRGYGSFTKILHEYVFRKKIIPLETAIYKMTGLTASYFGIKNRGVLYPGNFADLVLFNPKLVKDNATIKDSHALSDGIEMVWVNGKLVYKNKKSVSNFSGELIRRGE
ncbi:MAG: amidohydrolase family protein, partial [Sediminibacterium sp.]|nr:amidohydrolase family protein [Sediminibacterium sp.]